MLPILTAILPLVGEVLGRILPEDSNKKAEIEREINMALVSNSHAIERAAAQVITAEATSEHTITATWRPILMLAPISELILSHALGQQAMLSIPLPDELWNLLMIGVGGYVVGRSGEKIAGKLRK